MTAKTSKKAPTLNAAKIFAKNLRARRSLWGMTQAQLAKAAGIVRLTVVRFEAGDSTPDLAVAEKLAVALATTLPEMLK